jgi:hypothetical protein
MHATVLDPPQIWPQYSEGYYAVFFLNPDLERLGVHGGEYDEAVIRAMVRSLWTGLAPRRE